MGPKTWLGIRPYELLVFLVLAFGVSVWAYRSSREIPQASTGFVSSNVRQIIVTRAPLMVDVGGRDFKVPVESVLHYEQTLPQGDAYHVEGSAGLSAPEGHATDWLVLKNNRVVGFYAAARAAFVPASFAVELQ